jgi:hypothetical protein
MKLRYIEREGFAGPPDGWPAGDHEEEDAALAKQKVGSGWYSNDEPKQPIKKEASA